MEAAQKDRLFVPKELAPGETRVAATPETVARLTKLGLAVEVQAGAGEGACIGDDDYRSAGAQIAGPEALERAALVARVQPPSVEEARRMRRGTLLVSFAQPAARPELVRALAAQGIGSFAMELVPRITRAQSADALSSQATIAGYKAVLLAADHLKKLCPLLMTAAGTVKPARAVIFGAGVAGLQAIATARRLGCIVEATDVRLAAKEQVESLGGRFIEVPGMADLEGEGGYAKEASPEFLRRQREEVEKRVVAADFVVTTALVPGRRAPLLVEERTVKAMRRGSVIVDLAVESGGNCELSVRGQVVERHGVTIVGLENLPALVPIHASELYARNVLALVQLMTTKEGRLAPNLEDEVLRGCLLTREGEIVHAPTKKSLEASEQSV